MIRSQQAEPGTEHRLALGVRIRSILSASANHWPEYCIEAALLGLFMLSACTITTVLELPVSPLHQALPSAFARRFFTGLVMGLTAVLLIYSPWGQRSGAHINPSVTLTFYRLGKIRSVDAVLYILAQFVGGLAGVFTASRLLGSRIAQPEIHYAATYPGRYGVFPAALSELIISFLLMSTILFVSSKATLKPFTGLFAGLIVAAYITFESPFSGMSMNPARTFASALPSGIWNSFWIYLVIPPLGMLAAAEFSLRSVGTTIECCKLYHNPKKVCVFCGANGGFHE
jgi:aquaporin Z